MSASDEVDIGEAARRAGVAASALRYWEREGHLLPSREAGRRRYGADQLRRVALLRLAGDLDLPLARAVAILDGPPPARAELVEDEIARLDDLISRARGAQVLLANARDCPHEHPASQCPRMHEALDALLADD